MAFNVSTGRVKRANSVLLYGVEGIGKTTLCAKLPGAFIIDTEGGSAFLDCPRATVENLDDLAEAFKYISTERKAGRFPFKIVVLDTVDKIWQWCADKVIANTKDARSIEDIPYGKGYAQASEKFIRVIFDSFMNRIKSLGLHVIACAHCKITRISPPDAPEYTQYQVKISAPNSQAQEAANLLRQGSDAVLFAHFHTVVKTDKAGANGKAVAERRVISTTHSAQWEAKNRIGMPEEIEMTPEALAPLFPDLDAPEASAPVATRQNDAAPAENDAAPAENDAAAAQNAGANAGADTPRDPEATRGMNAVPPTGAAPEDLGGYARHHGQDTRAPQPEPVAQAPAPEPTPAPAKPAPAPAAPAAPYTLPASFAGLEIQLCYYLQSKGKLRENQNHVSDIPPAVMAIIVKNEAAILRDVKRFKENHAPY